jgi:hypothetical protein
MLLHLTGFTAILFSKVLERAFTSSHMGSVFNLFRHLVGLFWTNDQSVAKASIYAGQHNTEDNNKHSYLKLDSSP